MAKGAVVEMDKSQSWPHVHPTLPLSSFRPWGLCGYRGALLGLLPSCQGLRILSYLGSGPKVSFSMESRKLHWHFSIGQFFKLSC